MKILLAAVNAKYIHSNLAVYSLQAYAQSRGHFPEGEIEIAEYTINHRREEILRDLYRRGPQLVGFSCYIWNISMIRSLIPDLVRVLPGIRIWLGGPEVSFHCEELLESLPQVKGIMRGEGEETFCALAEAYEELERNPEAEDLRLSGIPGLTFRKKEGGITATSDRPPLDLDQLPFYYEKLPAEQMEHRIIYYESSRGCPFSCSYCLSSLDKQLRFRSTDRVLKELDLFLERKVPQVKFVDRTFNCRKDHAMAVWKHIAQRDQGITNFHFEISADLLDEEELKLLEQMRPGLVQLEIGVQSTNPRTMKAIRRGAGLERIRRAVERINRAGNIHQHLDLIAGLPFEDLASFQNSFNQVYAMKPDQLQLGFLKGLKGSAMEEQAKAYGLLCSSEPPYEVLSTSWISYGEILRLKEVEEMTEVYYNSRQFVTTLNMLVQEFASPYEMFEAIAGYYRQNGLCEASRSRMDRYEILWKFLQELNLKEERLEAYRDCLMIDLYLRENLKSRPSFARDQQPFRSQIGEILHGDGKEAPILEEYRACDSRQRARLFHLEGMRKGELMLFDYRHRDPLSYNAGCWKIEIDGKEGGSCGHNEFIHCCRC